MVLVSLFKLTNKFECQWIVEFIVGCPQSVDYRTNGCISWHQDESHACGWIEFRIGCKGNGDALKHY